MDADRQKRKTGGSERRNQSKESHRQRLGEVAGGECLGRRHGPGYWARCDRRRHRLSAASSVGKSSSVAPGIHTVVSGSIYFAFSYFPVVSSCFYFLVSLRSAPSLPQRTHRDDRHRDDHRNQKGEEPTRNEDDERSRTSKERRGEEKKEEGERERSGKVRDDNDR